MSVYHELLTCRQYRTLIITYSTAPRIHIVLPVPLAYGKGDETQLLLGCQQVTVPSSTSDASGSLMGNLVTSVIADLDVEEVAACPAHTLRL